MATVAGSHFASLPLQSVRVGGHTLAFRRAGQGQPVLLVHGITTHSFLFEGVMRRLLVPGGLDLVAVDLLGCGASDRPLDVSYALKDQAELLVRFCAELGLGPVHVVGHDVGGGVGQILAVRHPRLVRSLALINTVGYDHWPVQPISSLRTPVIRQILLAAIDAGAFQLLIRRALFHKDRLTPALMAEFNAPLATAEGRKAFVHFARCLDNANLMEIAADLKRLHLPTTVIWGLADVYLAFAIAERLVADIPGARLVKLPTAGHMATLDEPELVAEALREHLDGAGG